MISRNFDLVLRGNDARLREKIFIYRGDYGIDLKFHILDSLDYYFSDHNDLEGSSVTILFINPKGDSAYTTESTIQDGFVTFRVTEEMTDEFEEIGEYTLQIRLVGPDYRVSIPAFKFTVSPIITDSQSAIIGTARVGYARVASSNFKNVAPASVTLFSVDENGYIKTNWKNGDVITRAAMNKIEEGIYDNRESIITLNADVEGHTKSIRTLKNDVNALKQYGGGGGGGGGVVIMTLTPITDLNLTALPNQEVLLEYEYSASFDSFGIVTYEVNGSNIASQRIDVGDISFDIGPYLRGGTNFVNVSVTGTDPLVRGDMISFTIEVVDVALNSTFDYKKIYTDVVDFNYTPIGAVEKTVYILLDGEEIFTETIVSSGVQRSHRIPKQSHGTHTIEAYLTAVVSGETITTDRLIYEIICVEDGNNTPIISMNYRATEISQYSLVSIPYAVYNAASVESDIEMFINDESKGTLTVDRSWQSWNTVDYPAGTVTFKITCGNVNRSVTVEVSEVNINFEEATEGLEFFMSSRNRTNFDEDKDRYIYGSYSVQFNGFNWTTNGWMADDGLPALKICDGASVIIPVFPFAEDFKILGKTIEIEFSIEDSINVNSQVCNCMANGRGFQISSKEAVYKTNEIEIKTKFKDKERIRLSFVVEGSGQNRMIYTYIDGVVSGLKQYTTSDIFTQQTPAAISLGSTECTIKLYSLRIYNRGLKAREVVNNFIYDLTDISRKLDLYTKNDVFDTHDQLLYNKLIDQVPCMIITGDLPPVKGEKKTVSIKYEDKANVARNFDYSGCTLDIQGTSSQYYPKKNYKFKLPETYSLRNDSIPVNEFCIKADYMESSHSHNTGMAKFAHTLYTEKVPPQVDDPRVRTTIDGFIIALFYRQNAAAELQYFGIYNFNNDKGTPETFGYSGDCECWEVCNNTSPRCLFQLSDYETFDSGEGKPAWQVDFEARYPEDNTDYTALKRLTDWIVSTNGNPTKFKNEFDSYLNRHYTFMYYIITEFFAMADSRAKNMFLATWDKQIWYPVLYDMDTMMGLNNEGVLEFSHNVESSDTIGTQNVFNGKNSLLWINVEASFMSEIKTLYKELRNDGLLTYDNVSKVFINEQIAKICQAQYNEDAQYKYINPLIEENVATYLYIAQGSREHHMKYWLDSRFKYMDSKFQGFEYMDNYATFRLYTPTDWRGVAPNPDFDITLFNDQYIGVKYGSYEQFTRAYANETVHITAPTGIEFNDTETIIYGATNIASLGDLSNKYAGTVDVSKATQIEELLLGSSATGYQNTNLKSVSVGNNRLLRKVNVVNCPNLTGVLDLSACVSIEEVHAQGSGITSVSLSSGGNLKILNLPDTITNLEILDKPNLQTLNIDGFNNVKVFNMKNTGNVNPLSILGNCSNVERVRLMNLNCSTSSTAMEILIRCKGMTEGGVECPIAQAVSGRITITKCSINQYNTYVAALPLASITVTEIIDPLIVTFLDGDDNVLYVAEVVYGGTAIVPPNITPTKTSTDQYHYTWRGWDRQLTGITSNATIKATFDSILRTYTIRFIDGTTGDIISTQTVAYGSTPNKPALPSGSNYWGIIETVIGPKDYISQYLPYPEDLSIFNFAKGTFDGKVGYSCLVKLAADLPSYLIIPFEYDGLPVYSVGISTGSPANQANVTSIYMPESVCHIGGHAFEGYVNLTAIDTPNITTIGTWSFAGSGVEELDFPKLTVINGESAFRGCSKLRRVSIGQPIPDVPARTFYGCGKLEIFECVSFRSVGTSCFTNCVKLKTFTPPEGFTGVGGSAFDGAGLEYVDLPKSCTSIGSMSFVKNNIRIGIFRGITNVTDTLLKNITINNNAKRASGIFIFGDVDNPVTNYEASELSEYMGSIVLITNTDNVNYTEKTTVEKAIYMDEVHISNTFTPHITDNELYVELSNNRLLLGDFIDKNITSYDLSNVAGTNKQATSIVRRCFQNCASLTSISGTAYLDFIPVGCFMYCKALESTVDVSNARFFGASAFEGCSKALITGLSSKVKRVGTSAFRDCSKLVSANIPNTTSVGSSAFAGCTSLNKIMHFPKVQSVPANVIDNSSIRYIVFGSKEYPVTYIHSNAITGTWHNTFNNAGGRFYIVTETGTGMSTSPVVTNTKDNIAFCDTDTILYTAVNDDIVWLLKLKDKNITSFDFPSIDGRTITCIEGGFFRDCKKLTSIAIPEEVTEIRNDCFRGCTSLQTVTIPNGSIVLGANCFYDCTALTSISLPEGITKIPSNCFYRCNALSTINIPSTVTSLESNSFWMCQKLATVTGCAGVETVGNAAFYFTAVNEITMPKCNTIASTAFQTNRSAPIYEFGSVGNPVISIHDQAFLNTSGPSGTLTVYSSSGDASSIVGAAPWSFGGAVIYKQA